MLVLAVDGVNIVLGCSAVLLGYRARFESFLYVVVVFVPFFLIRRH